MKNKLGFLTKMSLNKKIKSKWFLVANILLFVVIAGLLNIDAIIKSFGGEFNETAKVLVVDQTNYQLINPFKTQIDTYEQAINDENKLEIYDYKGTLKDATEEIKKDHNKFLLVFSNDETNWLKADLTSYSTIDSLLYQKIISSVNNTKSIMALELSDIDQNKLTQIYSPVSLNRIILEKNTNDINAQTGLIMSTVFPVIILPFFMLSLFLVQMIGAEVNDEKSTRGMEIIISSVSPKTHFFSKVLASNLFVLIQGSLIFIYAAVGFLIRSLIDANGITNGIGSFLGDTWQQLSEAGFISKLGYVIPLTLVLIILSFLVYSLVAGILSSMTTNQEDFQQIQTPIILVSLAGYYLAIMSAMFKGSILIRIISYIPLFSAILSPSLMIMGQIGIIDIIISIAILVATIWLLIKYGLKIYKVGILNYSGTKLWSRIIKAAKSK